MFTRFPVLSRLWWFLIVPILLATAGALAYLLSGLPRSETLRVAGIQAGADVVRDENGFVDISATSDQDAFFALGFAEAQDRMWQLEVLRRTAQGRLSEVLGQQSVRQDAWLRTLGLYDAARSSAGALSPLARASLTSYAAGVNAWLATVPVLPAEMLVFGVRPEPWTETDSLAVMKLFALDLGLNMWDELEAAVATQYMDAREFQDLYSLKVVELSSHAAGLHPNLGTLADIALFRNDLERMLKIGGVGVGSNAWVVSGKFTDDGSPLLANDPHLKLQLPSPWYTVHLRGDKLDAAGMTLVGLPVVVLGHNQAIAWGATNMMADVQDLYIEQLNPANASEYRHDGRWLKFGQHAETIKVRADFPALLRPVPQPVRIVVRNTIDGPVMSDQFKVIDEPVALHWTALAPDDASYEAIYDVNYAQDWSAFSQAFNSYVAPALNMLFEDRSGNIGYLGVGRIPVRQSGDGRLPSPGWMDGNRWTGYIPPDRMPRRYNPASGFIVSANDSHLAAESPYFISSSWAPSTRADRIGQLLKDRITNGGRVDVAYMERIQQDTMDADAANLSRLMAERVPSPDGARRTALSILANWNGDMSRDTIAGTLMVAWERHARWRLFGDRIRRIWDQTRNETELAQLVDSTTSEQLARALTSSSGIWCMPAPRPDLACSQELGIALDQAIDELRRLVGSDLHEWHWGEAHHAEFEHVPFSKVQVVASIFERSVNVGGSSNSVNAADAIYQNSKGYVADVGPTFRQVIGARQSGWEHYYMNSTGQSGNVFSRHYADMVGPFSAGHYFRLPDHIPRPESTLILLRRN